ncbi:MAG: Fic family protein [Burkholderiales bacterium]|jgi:Fic family protein|nr:Fic family protein [Burkholderiales bacterium]
MADFQIGRNIKQASGYTAFIPEKFPPVKKIDFPKKTIAAHTEAIRLLGKLDGISQLLPDKNLFLMMFVRKDASNSSQIEGTNATMMDLIESQNVEPGNNLPDDVDDILHYIEALDYGMKRAENFPFSLRFIRELHEKLMKNARATHFSYPGEFRNSQNWIGGTRVDNARFVPPPPHEMQKALDDFEKFMVGDDTYLPVIKAGLLHAQFETIHPFSDGNGRTGRMLITMFLWHQKLLEMPVLCLSSYFKKFRNLYYERLNGYHNGDVLSWIDFFIDGVISTSESAIKTCAGIAKIRDRDILKIQTLGKKPAETAAKVITNLYKMPIVGIADIVKWTGLTKQGGYDTVERFVDIGILKPMKTGATVYGQKWFYADYLDLFIADEYSSGGLSDFL